MEYPLSKLLELLSNREAESESDSKYESTLQQILAFEAHSADWQRSQLLDARWQRSAHLRQQIEGEAGSPQSKRLTARTPLVAQITYAEDRLLDLSLSLLSSEDKGDYEIQGEVFVSPSEYQDELSNSMVLLYGTKQLMDAVQPSNDGEFRLRALATGQMYLEIQLQSGIAVRSESFELIAESDA